MKRLLLLTSGLVLLLLLVIGSYLAWDLRRAARNEALVAAVESSDVAAVERLLNEGADPNACKTVSNSHPFLPNVWSHSTGENVFTLARNSKNEDRWRLLELLVEHGADVAGEPGTSILHVAASNGAVSLVRQLIDHGVPIDVSDWGGRTALMLAVLEQKPETVTLLLECGADLQRVMQPCQNITVSGQPVSPLDMYWSTIKWNGSVVQALIRHGLSVDTRLFKGVDRPLLHAAILNGDRATIEFLLEHGADVNAKDGQGQTGLNLITGNEGQKVIAALLQRAGGKK